MEPQLTVVVDIVMIFWLVTLAWILKIGQEMADEEVMTGVVAMATVSVILYTVFRMVLS